ncbi:MAG: Mpo1-like protein [Photobacterium frigidiphilum]|uniref:Mpo1 family 2-hydroxy fatty acid dioxygenase n=1 Tax=Photobacterium frigidiphilum TaxID=264736 RepID=UPI00300318CE
MKTLEQWFTEYGASHQNKTNQRIHKVAVPGIYFSIVGLVWCLPSFRFSGVDIEWLWLILMPVLFFYYGLSRKVFTIMSVFTLACVIGIEVLFQLGINILNLSIGLFIILWVLQFIGHKIEGKKPSFFEDLQFLLIGPAWVFAFFIPLSDSKLT